MTKEEAWKKEAGDISDSAIDDLLKEMLLDILAAGKELFMKGWDACEKQHKESAENPPTGPALRDQGW